MAVNGSVAPIPLPPKTGLLKSPLSYTEYNPAGHDTVILLHDLFHSGLSQWDVVRPFLPSEFRILILDWPGHGGSAMPEMGFNDTPRQFAAALTKWMTTTIRGSCHIVAAGLGAYAAIHAALSYPQRIATLTLTGFLHHADANVRADWIAQRSTWNMTMRQDSRAIGDLATRYQHDQWQKMNTDILNDLVTYPPHTMPDDFERLECPLLIIAGDAIEVERRQANQIRDWAPMGRLAIIPGAGHNAMLDAPGIFGGMVSRFLRTPGV
jgi:pimeloyl-ACP methyl ester carboxylesterase